MQKPVRDIEKDYPLAQFIEKLRRLADALEKDERFEIQIADSASRFPCARITTSPMSAATTRKRSSSRSRGS